MLAWILEHAGLNPGFLIGGVPGNFSVSARLGGRKYFVIEADEYDTAFFDKRAKFVHYRPRTLILNNLEFDHADIYENLGGDPETVPSPGAHHSGLGPHPLECRRREPEGHARDGRVDAARRVRARARRRRRPGRSTWKRAATSPSSWCSRAASPRAR